MSWTLLNSGAYHWEAGSDEALHYKAQVSDLDPGTTYQIRVVAKNGGKKAKSQPH